jgi:hypothetical protein
MMWAIPSDILGVNHGDDGVGKLIGFGVLIVISIIGSIVGKLKEKGEQQAKTRQPPVEPRQGQEQAERPAPMRRGPEAQQPPRRRPVRAIPPRAKPAGLPSQTGPLGEFPSAPGEPRVPRPAPARPEPVPAVRTLGARDLGTGAVRAATLIAEHTRRAVAEEAQRKANRPAQEERLRQARLVRPGPSTPADAGAATQHARLIRGPLSRTDLRRAIVLAEILGPPVSERNPIQ